MSIQTNELYEAASDRRAYGRRKLDLESLAFRSRTAEFKGLPAGVVAHYALLDTLKAAAPALGLSRELVELLDKLFSYTSAQDWAEGSRPIVWPSNFTLAEDLDRSMRAIQAQIAGLVSAGLVAMKDSPTGRRYGERDATTKKLTLAHCYGFDLSLLAIRYAELKEAADKHASTKAAKAEVRRRAFIAKTKLLQMTDAAAEANLWSIYWEDLEGRLSSLSTTLKERLTLIEANHLADVLERMAQDAQALLTKALQESAQTEEDSSAHESSCTLKTFTIDPLDLKDCNRPAGTSSRGELPAQAAVEPGESVEAEEYRTTPEEIAYLAPPLGEGAGPQPTWAKLMAAAEQLRSHVGISQKTWNQAYDQLGRVGRLITLADLLSFPDSHFTGSRPAYFQGMINRARKNQLRLDRALYGMRTRAEYRAADPARHAVVVKPHAPGAYLSDSTRRLDDIAKGIGQRLKPQG
jgi:replication initiation protein RepC